jgi:hypothetical protein
MASRWPASMGTPNATATAITLPTTATICAGVMSGICPTKMLRPPSLGPKGELSMSEPPLRGSDASESRRMSPFH